MNTTPAPTTLQPHQERMLAEKARLDSDIQKARAFIDSPRFEDVDEIDAFLLRSQVASMEMHQHFLGMRIERF